MKTTIEMPDALFNAAKALAARNQTTLRALIEEGLRRVISSAQEQPKSAFKLQDARVRGEAVLMSDPRDWRQLEDDHLAANYTSPPA